MRSVVSRRKPRLSGLPYKADIRPHLKCCRQAEAPCLIKDVTCLQGVQRIAIGKFDEQKGRSYIRGLKDLNMYSMEDSGFRGGMIEAFKILKGLTGCALTKILDKLPGVEREAMNQRYAKPAL